MKERVEELYKKWQDYKETAEQHEFPVIFMQDIIIKRGYMDLQKNWDDEHAKIFIRAMEKTLKARGIEV